jgi:hypothetical protein
LQLPEFAGARIMREVVEPTSNLPMAIAAGLDGPRPAQKTLGACPMSANPPPLDALLDRPIRLPEVRPGPRAARLLAAALLAMAPAATARAADGPAEKPAASAFPRADVDFFETSVRPVLSEACLGCHGPKKQSSGLRLDSREALLEGGDNGPAVVPGKPDESLLVQAVARTHADIKMPPKKPLPATAVAALRRWVELGAPWADPPASAAKGAPKGDDLARKHWAFAPIRKAALPAVRDAAWVRSPIDAFVLARLEAAGLRPSPPADRRTLLRRATLDLLGVPPTAEEIEAFEDDPAPDAFARVVERLLASPLYGERWGRHWLDVARYADTKGYVFQEERKYPFAYTYRDYVIRAFNDDVPFDEFIVQQLAADRLDLKDDPGPLAAMGFLTVGRRFLNDRNEIIDDRIDIVGRGLLGLTIACARCHDHKYDPIPSEDYYSLYGVFASSVEPDELPRLEKPGSPLSKAAAKLEAEIQAARKARDDFLAVRRAELERDLRERFSRYLKAAYELELNARGAKIDERAAKDKLVPQRLRAAIFLWKRKLDAADPAKDAILGPWRQFAALPKDGFAQQAAELSRHLTAAHPLLARAFREHPPASMDDVAGRYVEVLAKLEERCREVDPETKQPRAALADASWESLRKALFGEGGVVEVPKEGARFLLDRAERTKYTQLGNKVQKLEAQSAGTIGRAMVMKDAERPVEPRVFVRGNPGRPGKQVPRRFLKVLSGPDRKPFDTGSGRLDLARAIVDPKNPLTARVLANRVWLWHFGQGLVTTPSDFGLRSDPPSHPELLDYLAARLREGGWSLKTLHRLILLSSAYQQQSVARPDYHERDPQNRLVWRYNRQRLDFETMRDSVLAVAGTLDPAEGGPAVSLNEPPFPPRRTVYGFIDRQNLDGVYRTFDFAVPDATSPRRFVTTVPQQALFLMNSPFIQEQARKLAATLEQEASSDPAGRVRAVYRRVLGRAPDDRETALGAAFLGRKAEAADALPPLAQLAQVLLLTNEFMFID